MGPQPQTVSELLWIVMSLLGTAVAVLLVAYIRSTYMTKDQCRLAQDTCTVCKDIRVMRKALASLITYNSEIPPTDKKTLIDEIMPQ